MPKYNLYAGYGANRQPEMIQAITGVAPELIGTIMLQGVELCVQRLDQTPNEVPIESPSSLSVREIMSQSENWGDYPEFETYTIRRSPDKEVAASLFKITSDERALIAEWEMIEYGWYRRLQVIGRLADGRSKIAKTEGLRGGQEIDRVVDGEDYPSYLNDPDIMLQKAQQVRLSYYSRLKS